MKILSENHPSVLVVEDSTETRNQLRFILSARNYRLQEAVTVAEAMAQMEALPPDLVILGLQLPDMSGMDLIRQLRLIEPGLPILALSNDTNETHKLNAFDAGADDFLNKPFVPGELLARLKVALRRALPVPVDTGDRVFRSNDIEVDFNSRKVRVAGRDIHLTPTEYNLLRILIRHANRVLSYHCLLREIWGNHKKCDTQYLRVYIGQLRKKLEYDPTRPRFLHNEPGIGYRFQTG
jgi:two-component system, OmpR family, KDP operon response regulator KdpE